jgi:hypothetical protein
MAKFIGNAPDDLGLLDISPTEMMFWLYCPIKLPNSLEIYTPPNLVQFWEFIAACMEAHDPVDWYGKYIYLTAKTLWVNPDNTGQREGWHCDGYGTTDINYIWADSEPTTFCPLPALVSCPDDHPSALKQMAALGEAHPPVLYPVKHILRMDDTVLHRVSDFQKAGMRSFLKLTVSEHKFNLKGNSVNHLIPEFEYVAERKEERNSEVRLVDHT